MNASEQANFGAAQLAALGQYPTMTDGSGGTVDQKTAAVGAPLVNYLRGQRGNEGFIPNSATNFFRTRDGILGDIVDAQPLYVRSPQRNYTDSGYAEFKDDLSNPTSAHLPAAVVYIAANDGMLHAINGAVDGGNELWAFIPSVVLADMHVLADVGYAANHRFLNEGTSMSGDIDINAPSVPAAWRMILVAGTNKGGKSYYALDIADPATPKALWQFTDADMGYSYGNPIIGKLTDGSWVVFVTSGINNADGKDYLSVLNAATGAIRYKISFMTSHWVHSSERHLHRGLLTLLTRSPPATST